MAWWNKKSLNVETKLFDPDEIMKQHFSEEDILKIQSEESVYMGVNESIKTGIENTRDFVRVMSKKCPNEECPVRSAICDECDEKHCEKGDVSK